MVRGAWCVDGDRRLALCAAFSIPRIAFRTGIEASLAARHLTPLSWRVDGARPSRHEVAPGALVLRSQRRSRRFESAHLHFADTLAVVTRTRCGLSAPSTDDASRNCTSGSVRAGGCRPERRPPGHSATRVDHRRNMNIGMRIDTTRHRARALYDGPSASTVQGVARTSREGDRVEHAVVNSALSHPPERGVPNSNASTPNEPTATPAVDPNRILTGRSGAGRVAGRSSEPRRRRRRSSHSARRSISAPCRVMASLLRLCVRGTVRSGEAGAGDGGEVAGGLEFLECGDGVGVGEVAGVVVVGGAAGGVVHPP